MKVLAAIAACLCLAGCAGVKSSSSVNSDGTTVSTIVAASGTIGPVALEGKATYTSPAPTPTPAPKQYTLEK